MTELGTFDRIYRIAHEIDSAFHWGETPQGAEYWCKVCTNLRALAVEIRERNRERDTCREQIAKLEAELAELKRKCC